MGQVEIREQFVPSSHHFKPQADQSRRSTLTRSLFGEAYRRQCGLERLIIRLDRGCIAESSLSRNPPGGGRHASTSQADELGTTCEH